MCGGVESREVAVAGKSGRTLSERKKEKWCNLLIFKRVPSVSCASRLSRDRNGDETDAWQETLTLYLAVRGKAGTDNPLPDAAR